MQAKKKQMHSVSILLETSTKGNETGNLLNLQRKLSFAVKKGNARVGRLEVSNSGIKWFPKHARKSPKWTWQELNEMEK